MKIVQSFWSKPALKPDHDWDGALKRGETGGWLDKKAYYRSWAFSCLRLRQYYDNVELVTDAAGKEILIDRMGLPYTSVRMDLDCLAEAPNDLWALGKVYAYSLQDKPFIHVDSDVYIWDRLTQLDGAPLMVQNFEKHSYFNDILRNYRAVFPYFPPCVEACVDSKEIVWSVNAGIFGGNDCAFIKEYAQMAIRFVRENQRFFAGVALAEFNMIFEQILFFYMAQQNSHAITRLFDETISRYDPWIVNFQDVPHATKYIHAIGPYKRDPVINDLVAHHLRTDFPEYYDRIEENLT
ncbi:hypothetical protein KK083_01230 [Fulvivirgaceae bacterium PWU4]|uniref:DUF6734 domain-containing protein n=1 Tax=Chryseosolibacter histidini TaxID=2782349 RepID=A0AAP2DFD5_9BACT|nr:DUF6734 family protein [Chryseosolibacter histidini]MBT1695478.1 hypothetical protein [Chryseosolibacter histidini]